MVRGNDEGVELEADQRHAEMRVEQLGLLEAKGVASPGGTENPSDAAGNALEHWKCRRRRRRHSGPLPRGLTI